METIAAICWNCDTKFINPSTAEPLSDTFQKKTQMVEQNGTWNRCPVCRYEDGLELRTIQDNWVQNIWLIKTTLVRCSDGNVRPVENWTPFNDYHKAIEELEWVEANQLDVKEAQVVTCWKSFERRVVKDEDIRTITNA